MQRANLPGEPSPLFAPYESAVDKFLRAGGHTAKVIRSPTDLFRKYKVAFGGLPTYAGGALVEQAAQDHVSVRGTNTAGHDFEWPEPE